MEGPGSRRYSKGAFYGSLILLSRCAMLNVCACLTVGCMRAPPERLERPSNRTAIPSPGSWLDLPSSSPASIQQDLNVQMFPLDSYQET